MTPSHPTSPTLAAARAAAETARIPGLHDDTILDLALQVEQLLSFPPQ